MKSITETISNMDSFETIEYKKGERLFEIDNEVNGVYLIKEGRIKLLHLFRKKTQAIWIAEQSELIGITSYFSKDHRFQFSAEALDNSKVVFVPEKEFKNLLESKPNFYQEIINKLCLRIAFVEQLIFSFSISNTKKRLVEILLFYVKRHGSEKYLKLPYSILDIAEMAGSTPEYILKLLKDFHTKKIIRLNGKDNLVIDDTGKFINSFG